MNLTMDGSVCQNYTEDWRISDALYQWLEELLLRWRPTSIVETGPGWSSLLFYRYAQARPRTAYASLNHEGPFHDRFIEHARALGFDTSNAFAVPLAEDEYYSSCPIPRRGYDLVLLDGPISSQSRALPRALDMIRPWVHADSIVIQDDTHRAPERSTVATIEGWFPRGHFQRIDLQDPRFPRLSTVLLPNASLWQRVRRRLRRTGLIG